MWSGDDFNLFYNNSFLHFILNESREQFSHSSGILPFRVENLYVKMFKQTFLLFDFMIEKCVCRDVRIWFKF